MAKVSELRQELDKNKAKWKLHHDLLDHHDIPKYNTGGNTEDIETAEEAAPVDFEALLSTPSNNPFLNERRIALGIIPEHKLSKGIRSGSGQILEEGFGAPTPDGSIPTIVDWRDRWGWGWITSVRDHTGTEACGV